MQLSTICNPVTAMSPVAVKYFARRLEASIYRHSCVNKCGDFEVIPVYVVWVNGNFRCYTNPDVFEMARKRLSAVWVGNYVFGVTREWLEDDIAAAFDGHELPPGCSEYIINKILLLSEGGA